MTAVEGFVKENRSTLSHNIKGLNRVSKVLVKQRAALDEVLQVAPTTLANLFHTYNPSTGTLDTRTNISAEPQRLTSDPRKFICSILKASKSPGIERDLLGAAGLPLPKPRAGALTAASGGVRRRARPAGGDRRPVARRDRGGEAMSRRMRTSRPPHPRPTRSDRAC